MPQFEYSRANTPHSGARPNLAWTALLAMLAPVLFWLIASRSLVAYLVPTAPETALLLRSTDPAALVALAEKAIEVDKDPTPKSLNEARNRLEQALMEIPLNARALRLLGQLSERVHADAAAAKAMQTAARYSSQETIAVDWVMRNSFQNKDYVAAAHYADVLLRTQPQFLKFALPVLGRMAEDDAAKKEVDKLLADDPPWRSIFFSELGEAVTDARTPLKLLLSLKDTPAPPTEAEVQAYLAFLFQHKLYKFAYFAWRQFLPAEQVAHTGLLFNGGFETQPSGSPFDWTILWTEGATIKIAPRPDASTNNALLVEFGQGRVTLRGVLETVMLPPGAYRLIGSFKGNIAGRRGLQWSVVCGAAAIGESPMILGSFPEWRQFEIVFQVPPTGCAAQTVRLDFTARSSSEQLVSGAIWFDDLSIVRQ
jgi:hypothetical protein